MHLEVISPHRCLLHTHLPMTNKYPNILIYTEKLGYKTLMDQEMLGKQTTMPIM